LQSANENVFAYYEHLTAPPSVINLRNKQQTNPAKNRLFFFKPMNVSNQHEPGPSCSKD
jgi:hypothetical protein